MERTTLKHLILHWSRNISKAKICALGQGARGPTSHLKFVAHLPMSPGWVLFFACCSAPFSCPWRTISMAKREEGPPHIPRREHLSQANLSVHEWSKLKMIGFPTSKWPWKHGILDLAKLDYIIVHGTHRFLNHSWFSEFLIIHHY